jgi:Ca2+-binding EF-hand superfamily protein
MPRVARVILEVMKRQLQFSSTILGRGIRVFVGCFLANCLAQAQLSTSGQAGGEPSGGFGLYINGSDIGTILQKAFDLDQDGKVMPAELKYVAAAYFRQWVASNDGNASGNELSSALKELFPTPPAGAPGVRVFNGVAVEGAPGDLPTPDRQLVKHILAGSDSNKDGSLSIPELNDWLDTNFSQWDRDGNGSLNAQELNVAFGLLILPDGGATASVSLFLKRNGD